ncbi:glycosyl transferase [Desulfonema ishimotonii]|uniref:Glycosyl transferase n=1 Tax=Desulfonema ishimotonii TaxID=45657 RepID=A0A401G201_9BACT|nr:glycosyltransferase [Desulfonema ishimotonii]GBC63213.1 glycosyl transferase [Desulfonema ishimotonii]
MARSSTYNILMYSHDTYGLGHIRRTMAIAENLRASDINILILTGSPIAGRFSFPEQIDFVRIPGMIKKTNEEYLPLSIKINPRHALDIRKNIITTTAKTFRPHLFIVDKEPLGLKKEVLPTLQWMRRCMPGTRTILGLRDIMDDAATVRKSWEKKQIYKVLNDLYSEIWVYGIREFYDPITEYAIPEAVSRKMCFTGYIPRKVPQPDEVAKERRRNCIREDQKLVVVTTGGGGDGYPVMDAWLSMLESVPPPVAFKSVLITGPFMPRSERKKVFRRARKLGVRAFHFYRQMEKILSAADLVISMGGYNTLCELLSQKTVTLLIPRETPRREQLIRAQSFHRQHLIDYIPWNRLSPEALNRKVTRLLEHPEPWQEAISRFQMTGLDVMRQRLRAFRNKEI